MSASNGMFISLKTYTVYFWSDGVCDKEKLGKFRSLEEAVIFAENYIDKELDGFLEYGIRFIK